MVNEFARKLEEEAVLEIQEVLGWDPETGKSTGPMNSFEDVPNSAILKFFVATMVAPPANANISASLLREAMKAKGWTGKGEDGLPADLEEEVRRILGDQGKPKGPRRPRPTLPGQESQERRSKRQTPGTLPKTG